MSVARWVRLKDIGEGLALTMPATAGTCVTFESQSGRN